MYFLKHLILSIKLSGHFRQTITTYYVFHVNVAHFNLQLDSFRVLEMLKNNETLLVSYEWVLKCPFTKDHIYNDTYK